MRTPTSLESLFLQLVNETRAKVGAKPLSFDGELLDSADAFSAWTNMDGTYIFKYVTESTVSFGETAQYPHSGIDAAVPGDRMALAGYGWERWGESIAWDEWCADRDSRPPVVRESGEVP